MSSVAFFLWLNSNSCPATKNFIIPICHRWFFIFFLKGGSACPQPIPLWVVIASIIGGVLAVGLGILLVLKIIIMVMERLEYHRFLKDARHVQWANVRNFLTKILQFLPFRFGVQTDAKPFSEIWGHFFITRKIGNLQNVVLIAERKFEIVILKISLEF